MTKTRKTVLCPKETPIATPDGSQCITCRDNGYFNLMTMKCIEGKRDSNIDALKQSKKVLQLGNNTLDNL